MAVSTPSASSGEFYVDAANIDTIQGDGSYFTVLHLALDQDTALDGTLIEVVQITWQLTGKPGMFTTEMEFFRDWWTVAADIVRFYADVISNIYAIAV